MPRARPYQPNFKLYSGHAKDAELRPIDKAYRRMLGELKALVETYPATLPTLDQRRARGPGRKPEAPRNDLIVKIAASFQRHSGWERGDPIREYRTALARFVILTLSANRISPPWTPRAVLRLIPDSLKSPR